MFQVMGSLLPVECAPTRGARTIALVQGAAIIGSIQIQNIATIGGNVCNAAPSADSVPPLIAYGASGTIAGARRTREILLEDFFVGPGKTVLRPDELLVSIQVPTPPARSGCQYVRHTPRAQMDIAMVGVASYVVLDRSGKVADVRIVLGAVAPTPIRARRAEDNLRGVEPTDEALKQTGELAAQEESPISDVRGSAGYRRYITSLLVQRTLRAALPAALPQNSAQSFMSATRFAQMRKGAILINNTAYSRVAEFLMPEHFGNAVHGRIYAAIGKLIERGQIANPVTLKNLFDQDGALAEVGGAAYLARLAAAAVTIINAEAYGRTIHDLHLRRELITVGQDVVSEAYRHDLDDPAVTQIERAEAKLFERATTGQAEGGFREFGAALTAAIKNAEAAFKRDGRTVGVATGFTDLDKKLGGLHPSDLIIVAGRPSMGKTALATNIATRMMKIQTSNCTCTTGFFTPSKMKAISATPVTP